MDNREFFTDRFGITQGHLERLLSAALARGGDYADIYFEYKTRDVLTTMELFRAEGGLLMSMTKGTRRAEPFSSKTAS
jgi:hypothetical protein